MSYLKVLKGIISRLLFTYNLFHLIKEIFFGEKISAIYFFRLIKVTTQSYQRILKLDDSEFVINNEQMIAASNFLKRLLTGGTYLKINCNNLISKILKRTWSICLIFELFFIILLKTLNALK